MIAWLVVLTSIFLDDARALHVKIVDAPTTDFKSIVLRIGDKWIEPTAATMPPVAIVAVVQGTQAFMGLGAVEGEFSFLSPAFDRTVRGIKAPPGSTLTLLTYASDVDVRLSATPIEDVPEYALGKQNDYKDRTGNALVRAVERGLAELEASALPVKQLIVITDGVDAEAATGTERLRDLIERGITHGIKAHAIVVSKVGSVKGDDDWISLEPTLALATYGDQIEPRLRTIFESFSRRMELTFPASAFVADGRIYDLQLEYGADSVPVRFEMPGRRTPTAVTEPARDTRWKLVTAGGAVIALLGIAIAFAWRRAVR